MKKILVFVLLFGLFGIVNCQLIAGGNDIAEKVFLSQKEVFSFFDMSFYDWEEYLNVAEDTQKSRALDAAGGEILVTQDEANKEVKFIQLSYAEDLTTPLYISYGIIIESGSLGNVRKSFIKMVKLYFEDRTNKFRVWPYYTVDALEQYETLGVKIMKADKGFTMHSKEVDQFVNSFFGH